jgi:hypothetical protein
LLMSRAKACSCGLTERASQGTANSLFPRSMTHKKRLLHMLLYHFLDQSSSLQFSPYVLQPYWWLCLRLSSLLSKIMEYPQLL